jgi:MFS transporter, FHS family, L-fucose permease
LNTKKIQFVFVAPVLLSFFVMSFCDLVGVGVDSAIADFGLNNTLAQLIPLAVFAWFFLLSVPVGLLQERIGKRNMLNIGMLLTTLGLLLPFFIYSFITLMAGFALLGIGNTIIQVSANPLLIDVVPSKRSSSFLSLSQFVKAVGSMVAPYLATFFALQFGNWKLLLLVFGGISLLSVVWLHFTKISEAPIGEEKATVVSCLRLLGNGYIALMVLGIFFVVGLDVGINSSSGQFLIEKMNMNAEPAMQGRSLYFFGKMLGTFLGALLLTRFSSKKFLLGSSLATLSMVLFFIYSPTPIVAVALMFLIGLAASNIFPLIFSITINKFKQRSNEISGLMIMAVSGGAFIPPIVGKITDSVSITAGMFVFVVCAVYLIFLSFYSLNKN